MQTVPFGGDLFDQSWPQWLSGTESGSMKLIRLCLQCPDTTDPVQFLKWFLYIGTCYFRLDFFEIILLVDLKSFLSNRIPSKSPETLRAKSGSIMAQVDLVDGVYTCLIENGMKIAFSISFSSPYRGPGKPYAIKINLSGWISFPNVLFLTQSI